MNGKLPRSLAAALVGYLVMVLVMLLPMKCRASAYDMAVEMTAEIPLTFDRNGQEFTGSGSICCFAGDARAHRIIRTEIPGELMMETPAGRQPAPEGTSVNIRGTLSARAGAFNKEQRGRSREELIHADVNVRLPLTEEFRDYGAGSYELVIPVTFIMEAAYGSYDDKLEFTPWEQLVSGAKVTVDDAGSLIEAAVDDRILEIPPGVSSLAMGAFSGAGCVEVTIPPTVSTGEEAFGASPIETAVFDPGRTVIPKGILKNAGELTGVIFPEGVTTLGESALQGCGRLSGLDLPQSLSTLCAYCLDGCSSLKSFDIDRDLATEVYTAAGAPLGGSGIEIINVKEGVTSIPSRLCSNSSVLRELNLPKSLTFIDTQAFIRTTALKELVIRSDISTLSSRSPFEGSGLEMIVIAEGVTALPAYFFSGACENLRKLYLPGSIEKIGANAFRGMDGAVVYYAGSEEEWEDVDTKGWMPERLVFGIKAEDAVTVADDGTVGSVTSHTGDALSLVYDAVTPVGAVSSAADAVTSVEAD